MGMTNPLLYLTRPSDRFQALLIAVALYEANVEKEFVALIMGMDNVTTEWLERQPSPTREQIQAIGIQWRKALKDGKAKLDAHGLELPKMVSTSKRKRR